MATKFNVTVNPFTQKVCVEARIDGVTSETVLHYEDLNYWGEFELNGQLFELILEYDYDLQAAVSDTLGKYPVKLTTITKDEF